MMIRFSLVLAFGVALGACAPGVPDSGRGVGFGDEFEADQRARNAALARTNIVAPVRVNNGVNVVTPVPVNSGTNVVTPVPGSAEATAAETSRVLAATRPDGVAPVNASPTNPPPPVLDNAGISNENNFDAVSGQRSIAGDAARIASNATQYQVVQPEALPDRSSAGPNIVAFAIQTSHARGTQVYRRSFTRAAKTQRACAVYGNADQAQIDFLSQGGPEKDRAGVDPDGDGFACNWDPSPYRRAAQAG